MTVRIFVVALALTLSGCVSDEKKLTTVSPGLFGGPIRTKAASMKEAPPATQKTALRVNELGRKLLAANPRLNKQTAFLTLGVSQLEVFHRVRKDSAAIYITEGLVNQCKSDSELAAVLCQELGKMASEQVALMTPARKLPDPPPLMSPHIGNDIGGPFGTADRTEQMVQGHLANERRRTRDAMPPPPPPETLARLYLRNAGYNAKDLDAVTPLLRKAEQEDGIEKQMSGKLGR